MAAGSDQGEVCAGCGRAIRGRYFTALGRAWHQECFRCAGCGQVIQEQRFLERDGRPYHRACYHERFSPRCAACGRPIAGECTTAMGRRWHPEHFVCTRCRRPFAGQGYYEHDGRAYCEGCYNELFGRRCAVCSEYIKGTYYSDGWGNPYCARHEGKVARCFSCGRHIAKRLTGGGVRFRDGRAMCNLCRQTGIDRPQEGLPVLAEVRRALAGMGLDLGTVAIPLRLVAQPALLDPSDAPSGSALGRLCSTSWREGGRVVQREVKEMLVLHGLPREHFATIVAHELGHAWLALHVLHELSREVEEGLCELTEYLWLRRQGTPEAARRIRLMEQNEDPIYGAGFRAARRAVDGRTPAELFRFVAHHGRLP